MPKKSWVTTRVIFSIAEEPENGSPCDPKLLYQKVEAYLFSEWHLAPKDMSIGPAIQSPSDTHIYESTVTLFTDKTVPSALFPRASL
jgi:hypothetical protein